MAAVWLAAASVFALQSGDVNTLSSGWSATSHGGSSSSSGSSSNSSHSHSSHSSESTNTSSVGWKIGALGASCTATCVTQNMMCSEEKMAEHYAKIGTVHEINKILTSFGRDACTEPTCYGPDDVWNIPNFAPVEGENEVFCAITNTTERALDTFDCCAAPPEDSHRVCWCAEGEAPECPTADDDASGSESGSDSGSNSSSHSGSSGSSGSSKSGSSKGEGSSGSGHGGGHGGGGGGNGGWKKSHYGSKSGSYGSKSGSYGVSGSR